MSKFTASLLNEVGDRLEFRTEKDSKIIEVFIKEKKIDVIHSQRPILDGSDLFKKATKYSKK